MTRFDPARALVWLLAGYLVGVYSGMAYLEVTRSRALIVPPPEYTSPTPYCFAEQYGSYIPCRYSKKEYSA